MTCWREITSNSQSKSCESKVRRLKKSSEIEVERFSFLCPLNFSHGGFIFFSSSGVGLENASQWMMISLLSLVTVRHSLRYMVAGVLGVS